MSPILPKDQMTEEDIKLNYITPAIQSRGWKDRITMETAVYFTDGKINIQGNVAVRGVRKKADYRPLLVSYSCCTIKNMQDYVLPEFVFFVLKTPLTQGEINRYINKTTQPNVGLASIKQFLFPLPPLDEQKRIVEKIEELLPMCERLK